MKITVKKVFPLIVSHMFQSLQKAAMVFVVAVIGFSFLLASAQSVAPEMVQVWALLLSMGATVVFWLSKVFDAVLQAKGSYMELNTTQLSGESTGFTSNSFTVPIQKIATMYVHQDFVDKLFGISAIVFTQMNSSVSVYGFEHADAQAFVKKFATLQSKK